MSQPMLNQGCCTVCKSNNVTDVIDLLQIPVHCNVLWSTREAAINSPRADIRLTFCENCGHLYNRAFDPLHMAYNQAYENSLHFSPRFQEYAQQLATDLVHRHNLYGKDIIEIGSGQGDFLKLLCDLGNNRGIGFDPSYLPDGTAGSMLTFVQDFYSERYLNFPADLICCRHTLEHIEAPRDFLATVHRAIGERAETVVFFEVPNVLYTLRDLGIWDLIYEHCSYFSHPSITYLFEKSGFSVKRVTDAYAGQFLCVEAQAHTTDCIFPTHHIKALGELKQLVSRFATTYHAKVGSIKQDILQLWTNSQRAVVWGAGSKGVTFLNVLQVDRSIDYVVDINPRKQGMYIAGTGQQIIPPSYLQEVQPDVVILMNPIYRDEVRQQVQNLGLTVELRIA